MFSRVFSCLCCALGALLVAPASAQLVVQDGDYYPLVRYSGTSFLMTGGRVDRLDLFVDHARIEGGKVGGGPIPLIESQAGIMEFLGGDLADDFWCYRYHCELVFHGYAFRSKTFDGTGGVHYRVEGLLLDGSFVAMTLSADSEEGAASVARSFVFYGGGLVPGDADGDYNVDLVDLNVVRNNFGAFAGGPDEGDLDGDGVVGLGDLNHVRNTFGNLAPFTLGPEYDVTPAAVPEPAALSLMALGGIGSSMLLGLVRCRPRRPTPRP